LYIGDLVFGNLNGDWLILLFKDTGLEKDYYLGSFLSLDLALFMELLWFLTFLGLLVLVYLKGLCYSINYIVGLLLANGSSSSISLNSLISSSSKSQDLSEI